MIEFLFESTRNVADLILSGVLDRHRDIQLIIPHAGGALPLVADRVEAYRALFGGPPGAVSTVREQLARLWYDMAGTPFPTQISTLAEVVGTEHLLYGSDYCWTPETGVAAQVTTIDAAPSPDGHPSWRELTTANASRLLRNV
jgi:predicted TIM-barrel fold metal-dependent hydrolase